MRKQRINVMLHVLTDKVEPDFRRDELRVTMIFKRPRFLKVEVASRKKALALDSSLAVDMVEYGEEVSGRQCNAARGILAMQYFRADHSQ